MGTDPKAARAAQTVLAGNGTTGGFEERRRDDTEKSVMDNQFIIAVFAGVVVATMVMLIGMTILSDQFNSPGFSEFIKQKNVDCHICLESHGIYSTVNDSMNVWGLLDIPGNAPYTDCNSNCTIALESVFT